MQHEVSLDARRDEAALIPNEVIGIARFRREDEHVDDDRRLALASYAAVIRPRDEIRRLKALVQRQHEPAAAVRERADELALEEQGRVALHQAVVLGT